MQEEQEKLLRLMLDCRQSLWSDSSGRSYSKPAHPEACSKIRDSVLVPAGSVRAALMLMGEGTLS